MLILDSFPGAYGEPSMSGFCAKAMILLDMARQDWRPRFIVDTRAAPFGKLPVLHTPGSVVGDSNLMIPWLERQGADLFPGLDSAGRAQAHALIRLAEENLRYGMMHDRWADPEGWAAFAPVVFAGMPAPLRLVVPGRIRRGIVQGLRWQGLGRFGAAERQAYFDADLAALTDLLWGRDWLMGDAPTAADAAVLPVLSGIERLPTATALQRAVAGNPTLMRYVERGRDALYAPLSVARASAA